MKTQVFSFLVLTIGLVQVLSDHRVFPEDVDKYRGRIISGWPAAPNQFPHQVFFQTASEHGILYSCGGSLITNQWVLTAAHCLWEKTFVLVHLGNVNITTPELIFEATAFYTHPDFISDAVSSDVGLIDLGRTVPTSESIRPIRLANDITQTYTGESVTVSGWGYTVNHGDSSETLNYVNLTVIENSVCQTYYDNPVTEIISDYILCTVGSSDPSQSTCSGDSGSPLMHYEPDGEPLLIGVVSFGKNTICDAGTPPGFVRTYFFLDWINDTINAVN